jgi:hypothetical protein
MPEVSLYGICPRARFGAWPFLLSQNDKDGCRGVPERVRSKQPKTPNSVLIGFRNVLSPAVNELFRCALNVNPATQLFVFVPKPNGSLPDPGDTTLRHGRPPYVATGVLQEMPFVLERLNLDTPPASFQMLGLSILGSRDLGSAVQLPVHPAAGGRDQNVSTQHSATNFGAIHRRTRALGRLASSGRSPTALR